MGGIKKIWFTNWKHWRAISFVYAIQFILSFIVAIVFCGAICDSLEGSMVLDRLALGFDRTVIMDVINTNPGVLDKTKSVALALLGCYLLVSVFLQAGWIANIKKNDLTLSSLLRNGMQFFFPFLGIALLALLLVILFGVAVGGGFSMIVGDPLETFSSEKPYVLWILFLLFVFIIWMILVWSWSVTSRYYYIEGSSFGSALKNGFKGVRRNLKKYLGVGFLLLLLNGLLMLLYYLIMGDRGAPSWVVVIFGILVQQIWAFVRIAIRGLGYTFIHEISADSNTSTALS